MDDGRRGSTAVDCSSVFIFAKITFFKLHLIGFYSIALWWGKENHCELFSDSIKNADNY